MHFINQTANSHSINCYFVLFLPFSDILQFVSRYSNYVINLAILKDHSSTESTAPITKIIFIYEAISYLSTKPHIYKTTCTIYYYLIYSMMLQGQWSQY
jgi:hypothetical protein